MIQTSFSSKSGYQTKIVFSQLWPNSVFLSCACNLPPPPQKNHMSYLDNFILMYTRNILKYFVLKYVLLRQYNCWNMQASVKNL